MSRISISAMCAAAASLLASATFCAAQQTTVGAGMQNTGNSFFEGVGVGISARGPNWFFTNGGGGVVPPFGGFDPNAGATLGFGFRGPGFSGNVNIGAAQGSSRGISSTAGSITIPNGGFGSIADVTQRPFVTGVVPVVGGFVDQSVPQFGLAGGGPAPSGFTLLDERLSRLQDGGEALRPAASSSLTSTHPAPIAQVADDPQQQLLTAAKRSSAGQSTGGSVAEIRRRQAADDEKLAKEIQSLMDQGRAAQAAGKNGVARIYFEQVARRASGTQKEAALAAIRDLR